MTKPFWTTWKKIALAILLGFLVSWLFGCSRQPSIDSGAGTTDLKYLQRDYAVFNEMFFASRLPSDVQIDASNENPEKQADTHCRPDGSQCRMSFNLKYTLAQRNADVVMLHEMCHVATWSQITVQDFQTPDQAFHGPQWRSCMVGLEIEGAFRFVLIDVDSPEVK
jgi:hypothetical protein